MARVKAQTCECSCKMKRIYTRAEGGKGWNQIGWMCTCGCGCLTMDSGDWNIVDCDPGSCCN